MSRDWWYDLYTTPGALIRALSKRAPSKDERQKINILIDIGFILQGRNEAENIEANLSIHRDELEPGVLCYSVQDEFSEDLFCAMVFMEGEGGIEYPFYTPGFWEVLVKAWASGVRDGKKRLLENGG